MVAFSQPRNRETSLPTGEDSERMKKPLMLRENAASRVPEAKTCENEVPPNNRGIFADISDVLNRSSWIGTLDG